VDLLLVLTYVAICVAIFKIFKIPLTKWTVPTAALGGIILIGSLIFLMNYNHPYTEISRKYFASTAIVPEVSGRVVEVVVEANTIVEKGSVLFKIDPTPFEAEVMQRRAALRDAVKSLSPQLASSLDAARAAVSEAEAERDRVQQEFERATNLMNEGAGSQRTVDHWEAQFEKWDAATREAEAELSAARLAANSTIGGENTIVAQLRAQLARAQFDLDHTVVRAPSRGYATQMTLRPGARVVSVPLKPALVFVHAEDHRFVGWFHQNSLLRLQPGNDAEVAFDAIPGRVFAGTVETVFAAMAEGQIQMNGTLVKPTTAPGRIPVAIRITDPSFEAFAERLPGGAYGQAAIYTEHVVAVAIMRKILLRMSSWMNYLFPIH